MKLKLQNPMEVDELKIFIKKLNTELKDVKKGKKRKVSLYEILDAESCYLHYQAQHEYFKVKFNEEKKRAEDFLFNEEEAEKAGWYYEGNKKGVLAENAKKQEMWIEKANTTITLDLWDVELDIQNAVNILKNM